jgi:hypothetical protein
VRSSDNRVTGDTETLLMTGLRAVS